MSAPGNLLDGKEGGLYEGCKKERKGRMYYNSLTPGGERRCCLTGHGDGAWMVEPEEEEGRHGLHLKADILVKGSSFQGEYEKYSLLRE